MSAYKHKAPRAPPSAVDIDLSDIIGDTTSNLTNESVREAQIAIENLMKEITAEEILLTQRQRDFEQESKQAIDELQAAERDWKSAAKQGQRRAAQQNELSRFQQEIRLLTTKIVDLERKIEEKKNLTIELKKEYERIKTGLEQLMTRFEFLETSYLSKDDELRSQLIWFISDQSQLSKTYRRDVDELKRMQQEHLSKLDINTTPLSFDELVQKQVNKFYQYRNIDDDDDDDYEQENKFIQQFDKLHDEHVNWLKKKKKETKTIAPITERLRMCFLLIFREQIKSKYLLFFSEELHDHLQLLNVN